MKKKNNSKKINLFTNIWFIFFVILVLLLMIKTFLEFKNKVLILKNLSVKHGFGRSLI